jgi:hypothetical protein
MMINPVSLARAVLVAKAVNVESCREMGRRNRGPYPPETCRKVSDACRFIKSLSAEARRYYLAERRSRWLTNCIVTHLDRKTFDLAGVFEGRPYDIHIEMPLDATLLDFLLLVMRCEGAPTIMRLDAAKTAATLMHKRPNPVITVERGRRPRRSSPPPTASPYSPEWRAKISVAVKIGLARRRERLSAVAATDEADRAAADG